MHVSIVCSDRDHPVLAWLADWASRQALSHDVHVCHRLSDAKGGDVLFLVSCSEIVKPNVKSQYGETVVLHASDLPAGRGWSPHIWTLLGGAEQIIVSAIRAEEPVDTGAIWAKRAVAIPRHALYDEVHRALFDTELALMDDVLALIESGSAPASQRSDEKASYYPRRTPKDSEVDPALPLTQNFNHIRLMDPNRYPAYFRLHGCTYTIKLEKLEPGNDRD